MKNYMGKKRYGLDTKKEAVFAALDTIRKMKTTGWKHMVYNDGLGNWFFKVYRGPLSISASCGTYGALLADDPNIEPQFIGGSCNWTDKFYHRDPNKVAEHQLEIAEAFVRQCQEAIRRARGETKKVLGSASRKPTVLRKHENRGKRKGCDHD